MKMFVFANVRTECSKFFGMHKNCCDNTYVLDITIKLTWTYNTATFASAYITAASAALMRRHQRSRSNTYTNVNPSFTVSENFRCFQLFLPTFRLKLLPILHLSAGAAVLTQHTNPSSAVEPDQHSENTLSQYTWPIATGVPVWNTSVTHGTFI